MNGSDEKQVATPVSLEQEVKRIRSDPFCLANLSFRLRTSNVNVGICISAVNAEVGESVTREHVSTLGTALHHMGVEGGTEISADLSKSPFDCLHLFANSPAVEFADIGLPVGLQTFEHVSLNVELDDPNVDLGVNGPTVPRDIGRQVPLHKKENLKLYNVNFADRVGVAALELWRNDGRLLRLQLGVKPRKFADVAALTEFHQIVQELHEFAPHVLYELLSVSALPTHTDPLLKRSPLQKLRYLRHVFERKPRGFRQLLRAIAKNPDKRLIKERLWHDADLASASTSAALESLTFPQVTWARGEPAVVFDFTPTRLLEERCRVTFDTYPNRFLKFVLRDVANVLTHVESELVRREDEAEKRGHRWEAAQYRSYSVDSRKCRCYIRGMMAHEWLEETGELTALEQTSTVIARDPRYRALAEIHRELRRGLNVQWQRLDEALLEPVKGMNTLYEIWCFVKLWKVLTSAPFSFQLTPSVKDHNLPVLPDGNLPENLPIHLRRDDGTEVTLTYQWSGKGKSYSVPIYPDIALNWEDPAGHPVTLLLDAKYRVDWVSPPTDTDREAQAQWKLDDLWKMHAYRDMIANPTGELWVIALYPGDRIDLFLKTERKRLSDLKSLKALSTEPHGGVGVLPFAPTGEKVQALSRILQTILIGDRSDERGQ